MAGISFTIANPNSIPKAGQAVIYVDAVDKNQLDFVITNSIAIPNIQPTDQLSIRFPKELIVNASKDMLVTKDWEVKTIDRSGAYYDFVCAPRKKAIPFKNAIVISFIGMQGKTQTNGAVKRVANIRSNRLSWWVKLRLYCSMEPNCNSI